VAGLSGVSGCYVEWQIREEQRGSTPRHDALQPRSPRRTLQLGHRDATLHLSTPPPLLPIGTLNDADLEHHAPTMNGNYLLNIPYDKQTRVNWMNSVGHQFERSRDQGAFCFGTFQCIITPRGSHEPAFYGGYLIGLPH
jgi:hypothetical protein